MNQNQIPKSLPPLPKLRPRPGLHWVKPSDCRHVNNPKAAAEEDAVVSEEDTTSRLLMKTDFKGAGRKRNSGSLVHSIPKFSQVRPNGRLTEVQKVLQNRIIMKQQEKQRQAEQQRQQQQQQQKQIQFQNNKKEGLQQMSSGSSSHNSRLCQATKISEIMESSVSSKRRGRKPAKNEICHVVSSPPGHQFSPSSTRKELNEVTIKPVENNNNLNKSYRHVANNSNSSNSKKSNFETEIPFLSEVTITSTTLVPAGPKSDSDALDLSRSKNRKRAISPSVIDFPAKTSRLSTSKSLNPLPLILHPSDYQKANMPQGYIFCPGPHVFIHHMALNSPSLLQESFNLPVSQKNADSVGMKGKANYDDARQKGCKNRTSATSATQNSNEVSICKFKFTGGTKPSLEEKKMLSMDSWGNLKYFSNSGSKEKSLTGYESLSPNDISNSGSSIVTERFTSITPDRLSKFRAANVSSLGSEKSSRLSVSDMLSNQKSMKSKCNLQLKRDKESQIMNL